MDLENFKKIKYHLEDEKGCSTPFYILAAIFLCMGIGTAVIASPNTVTLVSGLIMMLFISGVIFIMGLHQRSDCSLYLNAHKRIMDHGVLYFGQITGLRTYYLRKGNSKGEPVVQGYAYQVVYRDAYGNEKNTETYMVMGASPNDVGKRVTVYAYDGKCIVDAIEK